MTADGQPSRVPSADAIKALNEQLSDPSLKSSTRILILILLAMNKKLSASQLRSLVGLGKGSLENHLSKLESAGLIRVRSVRSWGGNHQIVEITDKGLEDCKSLLKNIHSLGL